MLPRKYLFQFRRAPGDALMLTALVRDLKLTYGADMELHVQTRYPDIWRHNPYIASLDSENIPRGVIVMNLDRGRNSVDRKGLTLSQRGANRHYLTFFHEEFTRRTGIKVDVLYSKPDLHLTEEEKANPLVGGRYWVVVPGFKSDMTTKAYRSDWWQEAINKLCHKGLSFVQEGATKPDHFNPILENVLNLVNKTSIRDLIRNIYHAEGIISGVSLPMHIAGALEKPCVVIMGGREEPSYEHYYGQFGPRAQPVVMPHAMLDTIGKLPCCQTRGCWLRRVVPLKVPENLNSQKKALSTFYNKSLCKLPNLSLNSEPVAQCMALIAPDDIVEATMNYYRTGLLPPL